MEHLEVSLSLETIIRKICEIKHTENETEDNFIREEGFGVKGKISTNLNEINGTLEKDNIDVVSNQTKSYLNNFKFQNIFVNNENENTEKPFSISDKLETTETSSGFEDLSTTKYDGNKSLSQETERKLNETTESKFTTGEEKDAKSSEDLVIDENEHNEEKPRILTSTPKQEQNENSFRFNSLDNLNDNSSDSLLTDFNEEGENGEYLNTTIDEAIEKYEKADDEVETKFKEVSVQTMIDQLLAVQCRCGLLNSKISDEEISESSSQYPPLKKSKKEEILLDESENLEVTEDSRNGLKSHQEISSSHPLLDSLSTKDNETTDIIKNEEDAVCYKKNFPRIRIGLSKRAKPPPLHNKLIY